MFERFQEELAELQEKNAPKAKANAQYPIAAVLLAAGVAERFQAPDPGAPDPYANETEKERAKRLKEEAKLEKHNAKLVAKGKWKKGENPVLYKPDNKLTADFRGKPLVSHIADTLAGVDFATHIAVLREHNTGLCLPENKFREVWNHNKKDTSQRISIQYGVIAIPDGVEGALFAVGDQPLVKKETIEKLCDTFVKDKEKIVVLTYKGRQGNPCVFPAALFPELMNLETGETGKTVIRRHPELVVTVEASSPEELGDIDTKTELRLAQTEEGFLQVASADEPLPQKILE